MPIKANQRKRKKRGKVLYYLIFYIFFFIVPTTLSKQLVLAQVDAGMSGHNVKLPKGFEYIEAILIT